MIATTLVTARLLALAQCCSPADSARIDSVLAGEMRRARAPGAAIVIVWDGRVVHASALGVRSVETREPMTTRALVRVGSVTKTVTALTAGSMAARGRLDLDAPIARYARDLPAPFRRLTMRQLLSHTAGLINEGAGSGSHDTSALGRRVRGWTGSELLGPAGDVYSYSSPGYWLAGHVLAGAAGTDYPAVVRATLLAPLGMTTAAFEPTLAMTYPLALDHRASGDTAAVVRPFPDDASTWPSGSLFASAEELARLGAALADGGRVDGRGALDPAAVAAATTRQTPVPGGPSSCGYALGLSWCDERGTPVLSHYGFRGGSGAVLTVVPSRRAAIVVLANGPGAIMRATEQLVLDLLLGPAPDAAAGSPGAVRPGLPPDAAGTFVNGADTLTLRARGDSALYRYGSGPAQPARSRGDTVEVLGAGGHVEQAFFLVRGRSGAVYLHDGLTGFRRTAPPNAAPRSRPRAR